MKIIIGHSSIDENGKISGGKAGDQTEREVCTREYYEHKKGWVILRPKDSVVAGILAASMEDCCKNDNIGYDQSQRSSLYKVVKQFNFRVDLATLPTLTECDCSSLIRVCLAYAGIHVENFNTATEKEVILATGKFDEVKCDEDGSNLKRGDILVTKTKGHTAICLKGLPEKKGGYMFKPLTVKKGSKNSSVLLMQTILRGKGYKGKDGEELELDGSCGTNSEYAINSYQSDRRKAGVELGTNKKNDGSCGPKMWKDLIGI